MVNHVRTFAVKARGLVWFVGQILGAALDERRSIRAEREYQRAQRRGAALAVQMLHDGSLEAASHTLQRQPDGTWRLLPNGRGVTTRKPKP